MEARPYYPARRAAFGTVFRCGAGVLGIDHLDGKDVPRRKGEPWDISWIGRFLLVGRDLWFYAGKLSWPHPLIFFYPRWVIDAHAWWQYLYPLAALAVVVGLWSARERFGRGALAGVLVFAGVLTPALGFFNVFPFIFSFVADHYQYHASIALIALAAAGATRFIHRFPRQQWLAPLAAVGLLLPLAVVARQQTQVYRSNFDLLENVVTLNPQSAAAHFSLGRMYREIGKFDESILHWNAAIEVREREMRDHPSLLCQEDLGWCYVQLGKTRQIVGRLADAEAAHRKGIEIREQLARDNPREDRHADDLAKSYVDIGLIEREMQRPQDAAQSFHKATEVREQLVRDHPDKSNYLADLAWCYVHRSSAEQAIQAPADAADSQRRAIELRKKLAADNPENGDSQNMLAGSYLELCRLLRKFALPAEAERRVGEAIDIRERLVRDHPDVARYQDDLAWCYTDRALVQQDLLRPFDAEASYQRAIETRQKLVQNDPSVRRYRNNLAASYVDLGLWLRDTARPIPAQDALRKAAEIREGLIQDHPASPAGTPAPRLMRLRPLLDRYTAGTPPSAPLPFIFVKFGLFSLTASIALASLPLNRGRGTADCEVFLTRNQASNNRFSSSSKEPLMIRTTKWFLARLGTAAACVSMLTFNLPQASHAATITLDTTNGLIDGSASASINGATWSYTGTSGGIATFTVYGDLDLLSTDTLTDIGSNGVKIVVGNNVNISPGATITINPGTAGGAAGANGGAAGGAGGSGGAGGAGDSTTAGAGGSNSFSSGLFGGTANGGTGGVGAGAPSGGGAGGSTTSGTAGGHAGSAATSPSAGGGGGGGSSAALLSGGEPGGVGGAGANGNNGGAGWRGFGRNRGGLGIKWLEFNWCRCRWFCVRWRCRRCVCRRRCWRRWRYGDRQ